MTCSRAMMAAALVLALCASARAQREGATASASAAAAKPVEGAPTLLRGEPAYVGAGKRDPFRPFLIDNKRLQLTPLQKYELGQLKVAGVISGASTPRAMVEDGVGMGYIVTIGTPMGPNGGVVTAIQPGKIVVEEPVLDYYGKETRHQVVMAVPSDDGSDKDSQKR